MELDNTRKTNHQSILSNELELLKDYLMDTSLFKDVIVFNIINDFRDKNLYVKLFNPLNNKFNKVVNINRIQLLKNVDGNICYLINCYKDTIIDL